MADPTPFAYPAPLLPRDVERLLDERRPEGDQLDYKRDWWSQARKWEPAKDVGALANHLGGHIVIGIDEEPDGTTHQALPRNLVGVDIDGKPQQMLQQALRNWLEPREVADLVSVEDLTVRGNRVLVVTVRPLIDGVALVDRGKPDEPQFGVPLRRGAETYWASWHQAEERMLTGGRRAYLRAHQLTSGRMPGQYHVELASRLLVRSKNAGLWEAPAPRRGHGRYIDSASLEGLLFDMSFASEEYKDVAAERIEAQELFVPWTLVDELWLQERGGGEVPRLAVLLRATVLLHNGRYSLVASAASGR